MLAHTMDLPEQRRYGHAALFNNAIDEKCLLPSRKFYLLIRICILVPDWKYSHLSNAVWTQTYFACITPWFSRNWNCNVNKNSRFWSTLIVRYLCHLLCIQAHKLVFYCCSTQRQLSSGYCDSVREWQQQR